MSATTPRKMITLEGMPGAGKTTTWVKLTHDPEVEQAGIVCLDVVLEPPELAEQKLATAATREEADRWYLRQQQRRSAEIRSILAEGKHIISDRSCMGTLAFAYARSQILDQQREYAEFEQLFKSCDDMYIPDIFLLFWVSVDVSLARLETSGLPRAAGPWKNPEFLHHFGYFYQHLLPELAPSSRIHTLDTSRLSEEATYAEVKQAIRDVLGR